MHVPPPRPRRPPRRTARLPRPPPRRASPSLAAPFPCTASEAQPLLRSSPAPCPPPASSPLLLPALRLNGARRAPSSVPAPTATTHGRRVRHTHGRSPPHSDLPRVRPQAPPPSRACPCWRRPRQPTAGAQPTAAPATFAAAGALPCPAPGWVRPRPGAPHPIHRPRPFGPMGNCPVGPPSHPC